MLKHAHAIIVIKNDKDEYLQYYDTRWSCKLFPNCKLDNENHKETIKQYLSCNLNLSAEDNQIKFAMDKTHEKYSESAMKNKVYHHYFYIVEADALCKTNESFKLNDIDFYWLSVSELEKDERIQKVNHDIVEMVKKIK